MRALLSIGIVSCAPENSMFCCLYYYLDVHIKRICFAAPDVAACTCACFTEDSALTVCLTLAQKEGIFCCTRLCAATRAFFSGSALTVCLTLAHKKGSFAASSEAVRSREYVSLRQCFDCMPQLHPHLHTPPFTMHTQASGKKNHWEPASPPSHAVQLKAVADRGRTAHAIPVQFCIHLPMHATPTMLHPTIPVFPPSSIPTMLYSTMLYSHPIIPPS